MHKHIRIPLGIRARTCFHMFVSALDLILFLLPSLLSGAIFKSPLISLPRVLCCLRLVRFKRAFSPKKAPQPSTRISSCGLGTGWCPGARQRWKPLSLVYSSLFFRGRGVPLFQIFSSFLPQAHFYIFMLSLPPKCAI